MVTEEYKSFDLDFVYLNYSSILITLSMNFKEDSVIEYSGSEYSGDGGVGSEMIYTVPETEVVPGLENDMSRPMSRKSLRQGLTGEVPRGEKGR